MARIFISHSSLDNARAEALYDWLGANGWDDVFLDTDPERGLVAGERWQTALRSAVQRCEAVLFLVSPNWLTSKWCFAEYQMAKAFGKPCFPLLTSSTLPNDLPAEMLAEHQIVDLERDAEAYVRLEAGLLRAGVSADSFPFAEGRRPYPGMAPLTEADAAIFFGRDAEILEALDELRRIVAAGRQRMLVVLGASGAGKSSLLRAGLWPRLLRDDRNFLPLDVIRPRETALSGPSGLWAALEGAAGRAGIAEKLPADLPRDRAGIAARIGASPERLVDFLRALRAAGARATLLESGAPATVILIDQGEELYNTDGRGEADGLMSLLCGALERDPETAAITAIRSDSYELMQNDARIARGWHAPFPLGPLPAGAFSEIIRGPARLADLEIDPRLERALLDGAAQEGQGGDALPLLAFTLERLHRAHGAKGRLTLEDYEQTGGVAGAIEAAVAQALADLAAAGGPKAAAAQADLIRTAFIPHLMQLNEAGEFVRRIARRSALPAEAAPLIDQFVDRHLLISDERAEAGGRVAYLEIAHEAMLRRWGLLVSLQKEHKDYFLWLRGVEPALARWRATSEVERAEFLLDGRALTEASYFLETKRALLSEPAIAFVEASAARAEARAAARMVEEAQAAETRSGRDFGRFVVFFLMVLLLLAPLLI